ncbi:2-amino-4-hydroxy-6-hydroxymethyldihydropteridine diphosphokinase [Halomonas sp. McH1-25]|uniref:2-amino-4-hydroxy-6- hydroxymethyldihydropteridine diphosphokinase n=1 Tax=unclassified Halomonas TaxID=2609666 RepID=UPI001EF6AD70|nr:MULTISPECIES: 2-amino-4-hydroxy-6-hydroxymethyldihydropteridine diphosphokinase [unclassified Halomonas]MCG7599429.1 2-amino-4-hydroxy-6-hydroxymethyldihydropteridine diphosphokinase [Halomonas sp. McH1-25]MCP1344266.1 2-amino-4-hydroxy-6-hydroxymethyldihydropteridine diphosphokinase [Halomonas sp. FL8]MCP1362265.1 2-amino-4-hydroxy-6-hydroxymethyldihydropteridine diphosphokinase [Halomonas sp. BBD45]MCP1367102.1 2-amino-4-hydroxy-6-hydroxymethyldihydropteridine diphosphokinase [Halomonas sp
MHVAYIGLGSNLDGPERRIEQALTALDDFPLTHLVKASPCYASAPVGPQDQPDFVNAVACISTCLSPLALLDQLQALEQAHRRRRLRHWGPRTLDLDLLTFDDLCLDLPRLKVPHPHMRERAFVLVPLADIAPDLIVAGTPLPHLLARVTDGRLRRLSPQR